MKKEVQETDAELEAGYEFVPVIRERVPGLRAIAFSAPETLVAGTLKGGTLEVDLPKLFRDDLVPVKKMTSEVEQGSS